LKPSREVEPETETAYSATTTESSSTTSFAVSSSSSEIHEKCDSRTQNEKLNVRLPHHPHRSLLPKPKLRPHQELLDMIGGYEPVTGLAVAGERGRWWMIPFIIIIIIIIVSAAVVVVVVVVFVFVVVVVTAAVVVVAVVVEAVVVVAMAVVVVAAAAVVVAAVVVVVVIAFHFFYLPLSFLVCVPFFCVRYLLGYFLTGMGLVLNNALRQFALHFLISREYLPVL
jgi:hypothetical protein